MRVPQNKVFADRLRKAFQRSVAVKDLLKAKICMRQTVRDTEIVVLSGLMDVHVKTTVLVFLLLLSQ